LSEKLTNDAEYLVCSLYKEYLEKRKNGESKVDAKMMGDSARIHRELMSEWTFEDVDETCCELSRAGFLDCKFGDDVVYFSVLSDTAIIYMENRFKNNLGKVIDNIAKIKSLIPFI